MSCKLEGNTRLGGHLIKVSELELKILGSISINRAAATDIPALSKPNISFLKFSCLLTKEHAKLPCWHLLHTEFSAVLSTWVLFRRTCVFGILKRCNTALRRPQPSASLRGQNFMNHIASFSIRFNIFISSVLVRRCGARAW
jgi:hypothetical protein